MGRGQCDQSLGIAHGAVEIAGITAHGREGKQNIAIVRVPIVSAAEGAQCAFCIADFLLGEGIDIHIT